MDGRNNPQDAQNRQLTNAIPPELNRFIQDGVTPEQFAENARRLEYYSRMNTIALQVYLERHTQQAEQRRQDELRLIQMAQQLASGSQQQLPPPPPPPPRYHHTFLPQQVPAPGHAPVQIHKHRQSYNKVNTNSASQHWSYVDRAQGPNVQRQQHHPSVNVSAPFVNQNVYPPREANLGSHLNRGTGVLAATTLHASQTAQPPKPAPTSVHQTPQYPRYSGITAAGSQVNTGHAGASGATANHDVHHQYGNLNDIYPLWVRTYGDEKAASMAREHMQLWQQARRIHSTGTTSVHSTVAPHSVSVSAQNLQPSSQIQGGVAVRPLPHPQTQEWKPYSPLASTHGQQASSQPRPAAPLSYPPLLQNPTDNLALNTDDIRPAQNPGDAYNGSDVQSHLETPANNPVVTSTDLAPTVSAPPSSQSILLASEEKETALYTMRGLAASIKRSLNAEKLAASMEPSASSDRPSPKRERPSSIEIIDGPGETQQDLAVGEEDLNPKAEPQPVNLVTEPDDSPLTPLPPSFSEVSIPQQETIPSVNGFQNPSSQHDSPHSFVPFSTLAGAVSFDNITDPVPVNHNPAPSSESTGVVEHLTTSQPTSQAVLHNHIENPFIPVPQPPFDPLSFPHRTPTPPLAATITAVHDEGEVVEQAELTSLSHPSTVLHEIEIDSHLQLIPSGDDDDVEMSVAPGEDHVQTHLNIAPSEFSHARDDDTVMQEADAVVRRSRSLDPSIREPDQNSVVEEQPGGETSPARALEELAWLPTMTSPARVQSTDSAETSGPGVLPKLPKKPRRKRDFYVAVPPASDWVVRAKHREAERKVLAREKAGQGNEREYTECELANRLCLRHCHWSGCQAVLNSMYALKQHVRQHQLDVEPMGPAMTVSCQWKQCRMVCKLSSLVLHLDRHIDKGMACIYDDCDERFSRIQDLAEHEKSEHADDEPPPSAVPRPPELRSPVALPQTVPSYMTTTRSASKPSITEERHARLGPWTLGMIIGHPTAGPDWGGFNTALRVRRTTRLTDKALDIVPTPMPGIGDSEMNFEFLGQSAEYDILEEPPVEPSRIFGELDTVDVTGEFYEGNGRVGTPLSGTDSDCVQVEALL